MPNASKIVASFIVLSSPLFHVTASLLFWKVAGPAWKHAWSLALASANSAASASFRKVPVCVPTH